MFTHRAALRLSKLGPVGLEQQRKGQAVALLHPMRLCAARLAGGAALAVLVARGAGVIAFQHAADEVGTGDDVAPLVAAAHLRARGGSRRA